MQALLSAVFTVIAGAICMRPENSREETPESYSRPRDLSRHIVLGTASPRDMIMKIWYGMYRNVPSLHLAQQNKMQDD